MMCFFFCAPHAVVNAYPEGLLTHGFTMTLELLKSLPHWATYVLYDLWQIVLFFLLFLLNIYIYLYLFILILDYLLWWKERFNRDIQEASVTYFNLRTVFSQANIAPNQFSFVFWWFFKQQLHNMHIKLIWFVILMHHGQCAQLHALTLRAKSVFLRCKS